MHSNMFAINASLRKEFYPVVTTWIFLNIQDGGCLKHKWRMHRCSLTGQALITVALLAALTAVFLRFFLTNEVTLQPNVLYLIILP